MELATVEEGKKLSEKRVYITGKLVRTQPVTSDIYMLEKDKNIGFDGGKAILLNGVRKLDYLIMLITLTYLILKLASLLLFTIFTFMLVYF